MRKKSSEKLRRQVYGFVHHGVGKFSKEQKKLLIEHSTELGRIDDLDNLPKGLPPELVELIQANRECYLEFLRRGFKGEGKGEIGREGLDVENRVKEILGKIDGGGGVTKEEKLDLVRYGGLKYLEKVLTSEEEAEEMIDDLISCLDNKALVGELIRFWMGGVVGVNLEKFQGLDKEIALMLFEAGNGWAVACTLEKFQGLDKEIALMLFEAGYGSAVTRNLEKFQGLDHNEIALMLFEAGQGWAVAEFLEKFQGLGQEVALMLFEAGNGEYVAKYLEKFQGLGHNEIALMLFEAGQGWAVAEFLEKFQGLDHKEIALMLFEAGQGWAVARNLEKFQGLDKEIALMLIEAGKGEYVAKYLEKFQGLDKEIALMLIEAGKGEYVAKYLEKFQGLDKEIALMLIEAGKGEYVAKYLEKFQGLGHSEIALMLFEAGYGEYVAEFLEKFQGLGHKEIALMLIEEGYGEYVAGNLEKFQGLDHKEIALMLFKAGKGEYVAGNLEKFQGLDKEIALMLIEEGYGEYVAGNLEKFQGLDHKEIALMLFKAGKGEYVARYLWKFQGLDKEIALMLFKAGKSSAVAENLEKFQGLDEELVDRIGVIYRVAENLKVNDGKEIKCGIGNIWEFFKYFNFWDQNVTLFFQKLKKEFYTLAPRLSVQLLEAVEKGVVGVKDLDSLFELLKEVKSLDARLVRLFLEARDKKVFLFRAKDLIEKISGDQEVDLKDEFTVAIAEVVFPNNAGSWGKNVRLDVGDVKGRAKYKFPVNSSLDLGSVTELKIKEGMKLDVGKFDRMKGQFLAWSERWKGFGFDQKLMLDDFEKQVDGLIGEVGNGLKLEQKLFVLMVKSLVDSKLKSRLKRLLIGYKFVKNEDIRAFIQGTTDKVGLARNADYAYLSELYYFYFDQIKDVIGTIVKEADQDGWIDKMMPKFFIEIREGEKKADLEKLNLDKELDIEGFRKQFARVLGDKKNRKAFTAAKLMVKNKKKKLAEIARKAGNEKFDNPLKFRLRDVSKEEFLRVDEDLKLGEYSLEGFEKYLAGRFNEIFDDEKREIKLELDKFESVEAEGMRPEKLKAVFSMAPVMKLARRVGGVCVPGDESQWKDLSYQQVVYFGEDGLCKGVTMMNIWEEGGKKWLVVSPNPSQTYFYGVDEKALYRAMMGQIIEFAKLNGIDGVGFSTNKNIRTNRTGGEFEKAMDSDVLAVGKKVVFERKRVFSTSPSYEVGEVDLVWGRGEL